MIDERLTEKQVERRYVIMMQVVQQYIFDKKLDALPDDVLLATVRSYDRLFTHAGIPTERIPDVYAEAMTHHGQYLLRVDDYLRAWERIKPQEGDGVDLTPMGERGTGCSICKGTGMTEIFVPFDLKKPDIGEVMKKECPYHCQVVTSLARQ